MMEKLGSTVTPASPLDLPCRSSSSSSEASSPDCASIQQHSPLQRGTSLSTEDRAGVDAPAFPPAQGNSPHVVTEAAATPAAMDAGCHDEHPQGGPASTAEQDVSAARLPNLSSPPPLLPAPAKSHPCPVPPTTSTASLPLCSSSSPLPPHIPVISLGHSKPPLPLTGTPLTALHPIPSLLHGPHGDLRRGQMTCLPVAHPGSSAGSIGPPAPSPGPLFPQQYLSAHPLFTR